MILELQINYLVVLVHVTHIQPVVIMAILLYELILEDLFNSPLNNMTNILPRHQEAIV